MRIVFAGTPEFAVPALNIFSDNELCAVLTMPGRQFGRNTVVSNMAINNAALDRKLKILQPERLDQDFVIQVQRLKPDLLLSVAYGKIFRSSFLGVFPHGGLNLHPSLLPELRGPAPIAAAIRLGLKVTGVSIQKICSEVDAGDIIVQKKHPLSGTETTKSLSVQLSRIGAGALREAVDAIEKGVERLRPQDHCLATYCHFINKKDGLINWRLPARVIERAVRAYDPWPRTFTTWNGLQLMISEVMIEHDADHFQDMLPGQVVRIDRSRGILITTGEKHLWVKRLQLQGRKSLEWQVFANGHPDIASARLGT